ncbi:MAG TPA: phosphoribosylanthranilate isomerase [Planctomycetota bacterium]|nr:phosphoribosylanthranilate isomerase [Planctomycetota bacterium]
MKVKICGLRTLDDAEAALDLGAWALGFVFHRPSGRWIEPEAAAAIVKRLPREAITVGVFVDWPLDEVNRTVELVGLHGAQLHGAEDAEYARGVRASLVIKALHVGDGFDVGRVREFQGCRILLDTRHPAAPGGTGEVFDWSVARRAGDLAPIILAGGLRPENVEDALREARPDAIDVSSGVESTPGVKDPGKLRRLFEAIGRFEGARDAANGPGEG